MNGGSFINFKILVWKITYDVFGKLYSVTLNISSIKWIGLEIRMLITYLTLFHFCFTIKIFHDFSFSFLIDSERNKLDLLLGKFLTHILGNSIEFYHVLAVLNKPALCAINLDLEVLEINFLYFPQKIEYFIVLKETEKKLIRSEFSKEMRD